MLQEWSSGSPHQVKNYDQTCLLEAKGIQNGEWKKVVMNTNNYHDQLQKWGLRMSWLFHVTLLWICVCVHVCVLSKCLLSPLLVPYLCFKEMHMGAMLTRDGLVMVNSICQLRGCFWKRLIFKMVNLEQSKFTSTMWVGLIQSVEGLNRTKKTSFPQARGNFPAKCLQASLHHWLSWVSSLQAHTADFGLVSLRNHMSQFLTINPFLIIYTCITSVSLQNPD